MAFRHKPQPSDIPLHLKSTRDAGRIGRTNAAWRPESRALNFSMAMNSMSDLCDKAVGTDQLKYPACFVFEKESYYEFPVLRDCQMSKPFRVSFQIRIVRPVELCRLVLG